MLLDSKDGIGCDFCAVPARSKFVYYSLEFKVVAVKSNTITIGNVEWDIEICNGCYEVLLERCRSFIIGTKSGAVKCDLCPKYNTGNFGYFVVRCDRVTVDKDADPKTSVERNVMDFNVCSDCYSGLKSNVIKASKLTIKNSQWSVGS